jgi:hypothetical protein
MLYTLLHRHKLLPDSLKDPHVAMAYAQILNLGILHDGGERPLAALLETCPEPGVVGITFITEVARLHLRKAELIEVSLQLRERWFEQYGAYRVECRIPVERTQSQRSLKHMGFRMETLPKGIRNATVYEGKPVSLCIMSLLPTDPVKSLSYGAEDTIIQQDEEVANV